MLAPTHSIFGLFLTLILLAVFGVKEGLHWTILVVAIIGSLMPDLDMPKSFIGRLFFFISNPLERKFGHRTITHSLIGWFLASLMFAALASALFFGLNYFSLSASVANWIDIPLQSRHGHLLRIIAAFSIGYLSHLILDMFNPRGIQLFWPNCGRDVIPGNVRFRPATGSKSEIGVFVFLLILLIPAFPISNYGTLTTLRWLLATPEAVIEEVKSSQTQTFVEFEGVFQQSREPVSDTAEVLDVQNKKLLIWYDDHLYTLSDELTADITSLKSRAIKTQTPIHSKHGTFTHQPVEKLLAPLTDQDLISGTVILPDGLKLDIPLTVTDIAPITQVQNKLILTFATKAQLQELRVDDAFLQHQKDLRHRLATLTQTHKNLTAQRNALTNTDSDLTELGKEILGSHKENLTQRQDALQFRLSSTEQAIDELTTELSSEPMTFSGDVWIRKLAPKGVSQ